MPEHDDVSAGSAQPATLRPRRPAAETRPKRFFEPTRHEFDVDLPGASTDRAGAVRRQRAVFDSRKARKGRYALRPHHHAALPDTQRQPLNLRLKYDGQKSVFKPHLRADVTFWVAFFFELGSLIWVANGFCVWLPLVRPQYESDTMVRTADALGFVGGTLFLIGAYLGLLEAGNRGKELDFGTEAETLLWGRVPSRTSSPSSSDVEKQKKTGKPTWEWLPHPRWREFGYLSAAVQMFAATIFWVATLTGLPGVIPGFFEGEGSEAIIDVFFWTPQVIGGIGFVVSASILCIEVQPDNVWWKIQPFNLGWQIGFWNIVGAVGFLLCGALGYAHSSGAVYESALATFWGSWAFLIGSTFQIYEAVWRQPDA